MKPRSYWYDPIWKVLRIISFATALTVLALLIIILSGTPWYFSLSVVVAVNVIVVLSVSSRTAILRARSPQPSPPSDQ